MDLGLKGKVAVITGGGQGIGRVIVTTMAREGAKVVIADINTDPADKVVKEVSDFGGEALAVKTDVTSFEDAEKLVQTAVKKFGQVDILIHNASVFSIMTFMDTPPEQWEQVIGVGQIGAFNCSRAVLKHMIERKNGRLIFIGSDAGRVGDAYQPIYASGKGGIMAFCKSIALDMGPKGITANVVCPALTKTEENSDMLNKIYGLGDEKRAKRLYSAYPMRRIGTPEDTADMVAFLSSERASFITGQIVSVNGGYCMA